MSKKKTPKQATKRKENWHWPGTRRRRRLQKGYRQINKTLGIYREREKKRRRNYWPDTFGVQSKIEIERLGAAPVRSKTVTKESDGR